MITNGDYIRPLFEDGTLEYELTDESTILVTSKRRTNRKAESNIGSYVIGKHKNPLSTYSFWYNTWTGKNEEGRRRFYIEYKWRIE